MMEETHLKTTNQPTSPVLLEVTGQEVLTLKLVGRLDATTTGKAWQKALGLLEQEKPQDIVIDAEGMTYCDLSGIGLLLELKRRQMRVGSEIEIRGLRPEFHELLTLFDPMEFDEPESKTDEPFNVPKEVGEATTKVWEDIQALIEFVGEACVALFRVLLNPRQVRWRDTFFVAESAGVNALPIIALISFLIGLIMAFQAAIPMRQFGAEIFVADLIGLSMVRELGPLMTAIVLTGRSGSAFAAELGTMKVNEEIDALTTMGLDPMNFLVVPRMVASLFMTPLLTVFSNLMGVIGGALVLLTLGYPLITYFNEVYAAVTIGDFLGGLVKSFVFGVLVAGVGCLRGLQTKIGPTAVGESTTSAVVGGIVVIVVTDGIFSVIYYYLGI
jgi:phospholipid/cholesterol/gamma-HCH transport system permease protein